MQSEEKSKLKIGQRVVVLNNPNNDSTFDGEFVNEKGVIIYFEYDCGCGQSYPDDPMIGVQFSEDKIEEFWKEEIELFKGM